jgi:hypothetical protein
MDLEEIRCEGVCQIHLTHNRDEWRDLVNTVTRIRIS